VQKCGFSALKVKGGVLPPKEETRCVKLLRERFPDCEIRFDPNAAWSVGTSINTLRQMMEYNLEYAAGNVGGIIAPVVMGLLILRTGSFIPGFVVAALLIVIGAASYGWVVGKLEPPLRDELSGRRRS